jgi:hypothetical protein
MNEKTTDFNQEGIYCGYCYNLDLDNPFVCNQCGVPLQKPVFLREIQLKSCHCNDCKNDTVYIKSKRCKKCNNVQKINPRLLGTIIWVDIYETLFVSKDGSMSAWQQLLMYVGIVLGVYFSNRLRDSTDGSDVLSKDIIISGLAALLIMPNVFERISFKPKTPFLVRFSFYFQAGVFADAILSSLEKELSEQP